MKGGCAYEKEEVGFCNFVFAHPYINLFIKLCI